MISLTDLKAICAEHDVTVVTNRFVPRGQAMIVDPSAIARVSPAIADRIPPGRWAIVIHPDDTQDKDNHGPQA